MGIMLWQSDLENVPWDNLLTPKTLLFLAGLLGLWLVIYIIHVFCYYVILGADGKKIPFFSMFKICFSGFALNNVTPAGLVGGEPYRIIALKKYCSTEKASAATLTFSLFYIIGHVSIWLTGAIVYFASGEYSSTVILVLMALTALCTAAFLVAFFASNKRGLVRPFMSFLAKIPLLKKPMKKVYEKNEASYTEIDENIKAFRSTRLQFWTVFILEYLSRVLECVEYFLIYLYLGATLDIFDGVLILTMASLVGNLIVFIPMQAGSRELGVYSALNSLKIDKEIGAMGLILYRVRDFICIVLGIMLIIFEKKKRKDESALPGSDAAEETLTVPETAQE